MAISVVDLTKALINCPSVTPEDAGAMDVLQEALEKLGFKVHRTTIREDGHEPVENLYARLGTKTPNICFAGHTDVVPAGDEKAWTTNPFEAYVHRNRIYGRGAEDMKGAIAAFVGAVSFIKEQGQDLPGSISLLITGDEEGEAVNGTIKALKWIQGLGEKLDYCLVGEPTNPNKLGEMAKVGRRGSLVCQLLVEGKQGHVAYPEKADNPVPHMINLLHALQSQKIDDGNKAFPPSNLEVTSVDVGNAVTNVIPAKASARFNIRFNNEHTGETMEKWVRERLDSVGKPYKLKAKISGESFLSNNKTLVANLVDAVKRVLGEAPKLSTTGGTSDARFIKDYCPVIEFGTTGPTAHQVDENVAIDTLNKLSSIYAAFVWKMMGLSEEGLNKLLSSIDAYVKKQVIYQDTHLDEKFGENLDDTEIDGVEEGKLVEGKAKELKAGEQVAGEADATTTGGASSKEYQDTQVGEKKAQEMQGTELGGKTNEGDLKDTSLGGKSADAEGKMVAGEEGKGQAMQATELGGKGGDSPEMQATELGGKSADAEGKMVAGEGSKGQEMQATELGGKGKEAEQYQSTELGGKARGDAEGKMVAGDAKDGKQEMQATELGGKGKDEKFQSTELGGKGKDGMQGTELGGKGKDENLQSTELGGKGKEGMQGTELGGKGKDKNLQSTELGGKGKDKQMQGTTLAGKAGEAQAVADEVFGSGKAEEYGATELGGKGGGADMQATELGGKGSGQDMQATELGGKGSGQNMQDTELGGKGSDKEYQGTELGGKGGGADMQATELGGKTGDGPEMQATELGGKEGDQTDYQDTELAARSEEEEEFDEVEMHRGKVKKEIKEALLKTEVQKEEKVRIDESNAEQFRGMIKGGYTVLSLLFLKKKLFERIFEIHGKTMKDEQIMKEIDVRIGNTRQHMLAKLVKLTFLEPADVPRFVESEIQKLTDEAQKKCDAMKGDPSVIRAKLEVLPDEWKG